ncbi:hypothetical protein M8C21_016444 [Ambrosia artemisiifolia]|uniref:Uncharacterized protein n=1 Tax=Ambrosia artemisiifolia TaxID=4212 RepID=A0AAD5G686_AMBAR|nr:hypothetical protein M8C21_016444 [Ambrosia artemisiifolia]
MDRILTASALSRRNVTWAQCLIQLAKFCVRGSYCCVCWLLLVDLGGASAAIGEVWRRTMDSFHATMLYSVLRDNMGQSKPVSIWFTKPFYKDANWRTPRATGDNMYTGQLKPLFICFRKVFYKAATRTSSTTDYIGLIDARGMKPTTKGQRLRKVLVKDERLRRMPTAAIAPRRDTTPLTTIKNKTTKDLAIQNLFTCLTSIASIREDRPWFYIICSICAHKMMKKAGTRGKYECLDDDDEPRYLSTLNMCESGCKALAIAVSCAAVYYAGCR